MSDTLEVWTSHRDVSDVVRELAPFVDETSLRLPAGRRIPDGDWVRFSVHLLDGSKVLEGIGRCQESTQEGASTYRVRLSLLSFDERNEIMWERMLLSRDDGVASTGTFDVRSLRDKILKPPPSAPSKSAPPPPPPSPLRPRASSARPPPPPKPSTRPPPLGALPRPGAIPRPSSFPPPRPPSLPPPARPPAESARPPSPPAQLEARPRPAPKAPAPSARPAVAKPAEPPPSKLPRAPKPASLPPADPGLVDDGWSDRPPPLAPPPMKPARPASKPRAEEPEELPPTPTQVAAIPPPAAADDEPDEPDSDATSTEIAAPAAGDAALLPTAERTSPAVAIPDSATHDGAFAPRLTEETHTGLRLSVPARLVEQARALAPNLPAGVLRIAPVRETPEEAVLRSALSLGLASLAALADADDEDA